MDSAHPRDDLVRAVWPGSEFRADSPTDGLGTLTGHFSVFDAWYEVDSLWEGRFIERIAPGSFLDTITEDRASMRVTLNHGTDPVAGDKPLGPITLLEEDATGPAYEVDLIDTSYNRDILPGLRAGLYGSSFRFNVQAEEWDNEPRKTKHNPEGLPERTITKARVFEFGPVTFPANGKAEAGVRSLTDRFRGGPPPQAAAASVPAPTKETQTMEEQQVAEKVTTDPIDEYRDVGEMRHAIEVRQTRRTEIDAEANGRELNADQQVEWDRVTDEMRRLNRRIEATEARRRALAEFVGQENAGESGDGGQPSRWTPPTVQKSWEPRSVSEIRGVSKTEEQYHQLLRDHAMRRLERVQNPLARKDQTAYLLDNKDSEDSELARRIISTDDPAYVRAWKKYVRSGGSSDGFTAEERAAALAVGVDATGGFAVPYAFDPTVIAIGAWTLANPYRQVCRIETIVGTDTWRALTATAIAASYATEAAAATEQGPTFARPEYIAKRAHTFVTVSYEMMQDRPDIAAELTTLFSEAKDTLEEAQFTIGVGTTVYPQGLGLKDAVTRVDSAGAAVAVADVLSLEAGVPTRHRRNAHWFLSRAGIRAIQAWETTGGQLFNGVNYPAVGNPVTNRGGNTGLSLLGYPVMETPSMPWTPSTTDTTWGVLFDPRNYVIVDRVGMSVKVIPDMLDGATPSFPTGEHGVYAFWRNTARVLNVDAGRQGAVQ